MVSSTNSLRSLLQSNIPILSNLQQIHSDYAVPTQQQLCWFNRVGFLFTQFNSITNIELRRSLLRLLRNAVFKACLLAARPKGFLEWCHTTNSTYRSPCTESAREMLRVSISTHIENAPSRSHMHCICFVFSCHQHTTRVRKLGCDTLSSATRVANLHLPITLLFCRGNRRA
jgi:hypothetical protein